MSRVLFICKQRSGGGYSFVSHGLRNSVTFLVPMLERMGIEAKFVSVVDNNGIDREVYNYRPTHVFIEALWVVPSKFPILMRLHPNVKWFVRLHSEVPFLANEGIAVEWLRGYKQINDEFGGDRLNVTCNSKRAQQNLKALLGCDIGYTPNYYPISTDASYIPRPYSVDEVRIGCFGAIRPLKNQLIQAMAAIEYARQINKRLVYLINATRIEQKGHEVLKNIRALFENSDNQLIELPWLDHQFFVEYLHTIDIGLQVSLSETFNIVAADMVSNAIPVVVSDEIMWIDQHCYADVNSVEDIVNRMHHVWNHKQRYVRQNIRNLIEFDVKSEIAWRHLLHD